MKKILILILSVILALSFLAGCKGSTENPSNPNIREENISIDIPSGQELTRLPEPENMPEKPSLPAVDSSVAPYIGGYGSSTTAYSTTAVGTESFEGLEVSYPTADGEPENYNYIWFDVYNYSSAYHYIRFDFEKIVGVEKIAVSAHYMEGYGIVPPVGVLVESVMDGAMSFVTNLAQFRTVDKNYVEGTDLLSKQTVCRLFVYLDTNPAQSPSDAAGEIKVSDIRFMMEGDDGINVDNKPKITEVTGGGGGDYTLTSAATDEAYQGIFRADYTPNGVSENAYVSVGITRFTGAYGRIRLSYRADNVNKLTVTDGVGVLKGALEGGGDSIAVDGVRPQAEGELVLDIRGWPALNEVRFYLDSKNGAAESANAAWFEVTEFELIYTPYATAEWDSTSKFHIEGAELGGVIKATYDIDVGYDYIHVPVMYWTQDYSQMIVKFKTTGTAQGSVGAERFGLSVNSNNVLLEVAKNRVSDLPYNEETGEYTVTVNLAGITKLATLNFFFDSIAVESFAGSRTVEFTSIEFHEAEPELYIGPVKEYPDFTVTGNSDGSSDISWEAEKASAFTGLDIRGWNEEYAQFGITVKNTGATPVTLGVYIGWSVMWMNHTAIDVGETKTFTVPVLNPDKLDSFELALFWNYPANDAGSVTVSDIGFVKQVAVGSMYDVSSSLGVAKEFDVTSGEGGTVVSWADGRSQWAKAGVDVSGYTAAGNGWLKPEFNVSRDMQVGLFCNNEAWLAHTAITAGAHTVYVQVPANSAGSFTLEFYFDAVPSVTAGSATFTNVSFVAVKPTE